MGRRRPGAARAVRARGVRARPARASERRPPLRRPRERRADRARHGARRGRGARRRDRGTHARLGRRPALLRPVAAALAHAHRRGVVHRDLPCQRARRARHGPRRRHRLRARAARTHVAHVRRSPACSQGHPSTGRPSRPPARRPGPPPTSTRWAASSSGRSRAGCPSRARIASRPGCAVPTSPLPRSQRSRPVHPPTRSELVDRLLARDPSLRGDAVEAALALGADPAALPRPRAPDDACGDSPQAWPATLVTRILREPVTVVRRVGTEVRSHRTSREDACPRQPQRSQSRSAWRAAASTPSQGTTRPASAPPTSSVSRRTGREDPGHRAGARGRAEGAEAEGRRSLVLRVGPGGRDHRAGPARGRSHPAERRAARLRQQGQRLRRRAVGCRARGLGRLRAARAERLHPDAAIRPVDGDRGLARARDRPRRRNARQAARARALVVSTGPPKRARALARRPRRAPPPRRSPTPASRLRSRSGRDGRRARRPPPRHPRARRTGALGSTVTIVVAREPRWEAVTRLEGTEDAEPR